MAVFLASEPDLGVHAFSMPVAPLSHCDRGRTIDQQACLRAELQQGGVMVRYEFRPPFEVGFATQQVTLERVAGAMSQHEVVYQVARIA